LAKVIFRRSDFQKTYSKDISGRILLNLTGAGASGAKGKSLSQGYNEHIEAVSGRIVDLTAGIINQDSKAFYNAGISEIQAFLKTGIKTGKTSLNFPSRGADVDISWQPLTWEYQRRKPKTTRSRFWKRRTSHGLSAAFGTFAGQHKSAVSRTQIAVTLEDRQVKKRIKGLGTVHRYALTFALPKPHIGGGYFKQLLQDSFFLGEPFEGLGYGLDGDLAPIGYLEGTSRTTFNKHRPFIAAVMASKGNALKERIDRIIRVQAV